MQKRLNKFDRDALHQALGRAGKQTLPVTTRSFTAAEISAIDRGMAPIVLGVFVVLVLGVLSIPILDPGPGNSEMAIIVVLFTLLLGLPMWLVLRWRARKRRDYIDPQIVVEVQEGGLTLRSPGGVTELAYDRADFAFIAPVSEGRACFMGIVLESFVESAASRGLVVQIGLGRRRRHRQEMLRRGHVPGRDQAWLLGVNCPVRAPCWRDQGDTVPIRDPDQAPSPSSPRAHPARPRFPAFPPPPTRLPLPREKIS